MTLNPMCENVETAQGVPLTVTGVAQCKIMKSNSYAKTEEADELLGTASEQFLGKNVSEIKQTILQTLEGHLRAILENLIYVCFDQNISARTTRTTRDILTSGLSDNTKRWLVNDSHLWNQRSKSRRIKQGVPQGGVLSPILFNFYMSKLPTPPDGVQIISYTDDCSILATGNSIDDLCSLINSYLCDLSSFFHLRNLKISPTKSSGTLFTTWTKEVGLELDVTVDGEKIPTVNHPKILGVTFDSLLMSSAHTTAICNKMRSRNKVLKSLAGSTWGMDKETLLTTYQTIGRSVVNYAAPVWTPRVSDTQWKKLQSCQNAALRTVTGCIQMICEEHLHDETKMLSIKEHNIMLSKQFLLGCHRRGHPNHHLTEANPTQLEPESLWTQPLDATRLLGLDLTELDNQSEEEEE
ncbi:uncharacterized protein LOC119615640 [Lucilia sericata]|nr:uncharacterized protein LOC119615640 [Lucilia sericata]